MCQLMLSVTILMSSDNLISLKGKDVMYDTTHELMTSLNNQLHPPSCTVMSSNTTHYVKIWWYDWIHI